MTCACGHGIWGHIEWSGVTFGCNDPTCSCMFFEIDDGTDMSPTRTGRCDGQSAFPYIDGKYGGHYEV